MRKLSEIRVKLMEDWGGAFPELAVYRSRWFGRLFGPVFQGLCLDRGSSGEAYVVVPHLSCLCRTDMGASPNFDAGDRINHPRGGEWWIRCGLHEHYFDQAVECVRDQTIVPLEGPITLDQVVDAYWREVHSMHGLFLHHWGLREDIASILAYHGRIDQAIDVLERTAGEIRPYEPRLAAARAEAEANPQEEKRKRRPVINEYGNKRWSSTELEVLEHTVPEGGSAGWLEREMARVRDVDGLKATVEENIVKMKMQKLPRQELIV